MGYVWFVKKFKRCCVWFGTYKKQFTICDPESFNSIPEQAWRNSQNKVVSCVNYPNESIKHLHLEGLSKAYLLKFENAEDSINSISAARGQYPDHSQNMYNYLKTSISR